MKSQSLGGINIKIWLQILIELRDSPRGVAQMSRTCRALNELCKEPSLWKSLCESYLKVHLADTESSRTIDWREYFMHSTLGNSASSSSCQKTHASFALLGHCDSGKSTLVGRLLCSVGVVSRHTYDVLHNRAVSMFGPNRYYYWRMIQQHEVNPNTHKGLMGNYCSHTNNMFS